MSLSETKNQISKDFNQAKWFMTIALILLKTTYVYQVLC